MGKKKIALDRANELKSRIQDYLDIKDTIPSGMSSGRQKRCEEKKKKILSILNATEEDWNDYKWQISNRISDLETLLKIISLDEDDINAVKSVGKEYRWAISPYYLSLIDDTNKFDPIKLQSIPTRLELIDEGKEDPMAEEFTNPAGAITRRYPDRLIINVTNECAMFCRH